jgi:peptide/nickel transport system ATP-binding protein
VTLLAVRDLRTHFEIRRGVWGGRAGTVRAVDGVSFGIGRGEAVAVVGESGCGKSTLAKTLLGLHRPVGGEVVFEGRALHGLGGAEMRAVRRRVGYIQQDPYGALAPFMTVRRILEEPLRINGVGGRAERAARVREALEEVRLAPADEFLPKFPHQLSGGQQQRVVIARAMILRPVLLIADEPVSMLDASVRIGVLELLRGLQRAHDLGVLYITHDLSTVRHFCDRILVMYAGKVVEEAPVGGLIDEPLHPYTRALLAAIPDPDPSRAGRLRDVPPGEPPSLVRPPPGCRFHPRCPEFMKGTCDAGEVYVFEPRPGHRTACWLYGARVARPYT